MRKIRNTGEPIDIDDRIPQILEYLRTVDGLVAVYLYGSYGTPDQTPLSDVDLALLFVRGREPSFDDQLEIIGGVTSAAGEEDISVTVLNRMSVVFQFEVLETGRLLLCRDEIALADFTAELLSRHADFAIDYRHFLREYDEALVDEYRGAG